MELRKYYLDENANISLKIQDILRTKLTQIDKFLQFLKRKYPQILTHVIEALIEDFENEESFNQVEIVLESKFLNDFPNLKRSSINKVLSLLDFSKYQHYAIEERIEIKVKDAIKAIHIFNVFLLNSITSILPLEEAIEIIKEVVDFQVESSEDSDNYIDTMVDFYEKSWINFFERWKAHDAVIGMVDENTIVCKITKCLWNDIMRELELDSRVFNSIVCYGDYAYRKTANPGFLLTRRKTLVEDKEMCDFCDHDTRFKEEIEHPPQQFWESL